MRISSFARPPLALGALLLTCALARAADAPEPSLADRGKYLVTIMDCAACHTDGHFLGKPDPSRYLAGSSIGFGGPDGVVYPPNLTPDEENGLGRWSDEQIVLAIRAGQRPDGRTLSPAMPWPSYSMLTDADARAIVAFLRTVRASPFRPPGPVAAGEPAPAPYLAVTAPGATAGE